MLLTAHNLHYYADLMAAMREAIARGHGSRDFRGAATSRGDMSRAQRPAPG